MTGIKKEASVTDNLLILLINNWWVVRDSNARPSH